jgi:hypothetical protein
VFVFLLMFLKAPQAGVIPVSRRKSSTFWTARAPAVRQAQGKLCAGVTAKATFISLGGLQVDTHPE